MLATGILISVNNLLVSYLRTSATKILSFSAPESFEAKTLIRAQSFVFRNKYDILADRLPHD